MVSVHIDDKELIISGGISVRKDCITYASRECINDKYSICIGFGDGEVLLYYGTDRQSAIKDIDKIGTWIAQK